MDTLPVTGETVLQLLRQLPPRERLHVVAQALPELERDLPATRASQDFWDGSDVRAMAERQGVGPVESLETLLGGWPEDESVDDFIATLHHWRQQNLDDFANITGLTVISEL